ncbi:MAG: rod-binding protein [Bacillota bacterium]
MEGIGNIGNNGLQEIIQNQTQKQKQEQKQVEDAKDKFASLTAGEKNNKDYDQQLKEEVTKFTSIFVQKMFSSMRDSVPESDFIDGGFAEDVYTDMMDQEISKQGTKQETFKRLNEILFEQLSGE